MQIQFTDAALALNGDPAAGAGVFNRARRAGIDGQLFGAKELLAIDKTRQGQGLGRALEGLEGTAASFEGLGIKPGWLWARIAGTSEVAGGTLTALGLLSPLGPIIAIAPMVVAWRKGHGDKPIWVNKGGAELPTTNLTIACALILTGPGAFSLDRLLGIRVPWWLSLLAMAANILRCPEF